MGSWASSDPLLALWQYVRPSKAGQEQGKVRPTWDTQGCSSGFWISFQLAL